MEKAYHENIFYVIDMVLYKLLVIDIEIFLYAGQAVKVLLKLCRFTDG